MVYPLDEVSEHRSHAQPTQHCSVRAVVNRELGTVHDDIKGEARSERNQAPYDTQGILTNLILPEVEILPS